MDQPDPKHCGVRVGMPALLKLNQFAEHIYHVFGALPMLVGSAVYSKDWRDVDVRLVLSDDKYETLFGVPAEDHWNRDPHRCGKWVGLCLAFAALGKEMTGLPIDFQIQPACWANAYYPKSAGYRRHYLGLNAVLERPNKKAVGLDKEDRGSHNKEQVSDD